MYIGDFALNQTVRGMFPTRLASGARGDPSSALETADIRVYKNGQTTQRSVENGYTVTSTFDTLTGIVYWSIDLSDDTDAGFFKTPGVEYAVVFYPDETIDSLAVASVVALFSVGRPTVSMPVVGMAQGGSATTVILPATASSVNGAYDGASVILVYDDGSFETCGQGATAYVGGTKTFTLDRTLAVAVSSSTRVFLFLGAPAGVGFYEGLADAVVEAEADFIQTWDRTSNTAGTVTTPAGPRSLTIQTDPNYQTIKKIT